MGRFVLFGSCTEVKNLEFVLFNGIKVCMRCGSYIGKNMKFAPLSIKGLSLGIYCMVLR